MQCCYTRSTSESDDGDDDNIKRTSVLYRCSAVATTIVAKSIIYVVIVRAHVILKAKR